MNAHNPNFVYAEHALNEDHITYGEMAQELLGKYTLLDKSLLAWTALDSWKKDGKPNGKAKAVKGWYTMYQEHQQVLGSYTKVPDPLSHLGHNKVKYLKPVHTFKFQGYYGNEYISLLQSGSNYYYAKSKSVETSLLNCDGRMDHRRNVAFDNELTQFAGITMIRILKAWK